MRVSTVIKAVPCDICHRIITNTGIERVIATKEEYSNE